MKKLFLTLLAAALILPACAQQAPEPAAPEAEAPETETVTLTVGATALPHAEILNFVKDDLADEGVELIVQEFGDYTLINPALSEGQIDANFFQHLPFLEDYVQNSGSSLVSAAKIHIEPLGIYSDKITDLSELEDGATVSIPNDATNEARALMLLESQGIIVLAEGAGLNATPNDIADNPLNLIFNELDAAVIPRAMSESTISVINTNYALEAGLTPLQDALAMEGSDSPYANIIVVREEDKDNEAVGKLISALQTDRVRDFILENYDGAVVPVF